MRTNKFCLLLFLIVFFAVPVFSGEAALVGETNKAVLSISPQTGEYNINDTFKINIYINTSGQYVNAVAAHLKYDKTRFEAINIDTSGSAFNMAAETKINSNSGQIKISVGTPTPGINTSNGLVASAVFKALSAVTPLSDNLVFDFLSEDAAKSAAFLDDGKGTNFLSGVYGGRYQIGEGGPVSYLDGALLKAVGGTKIYVIDGNQKRWIPTADIFNSKGYKWNNIVEISQSIFDSIATGPDIAGSVSIPEGGLIRANGGIDIYIVKYVGVKKFKRLILSPSVFNSYQHLKWSDVKDVVQSVVDSFVASDLVRAVNDSRVYKLYPSGDAGEKRWIKTGEAFSRLGFDWDSVYQINQVDRDSYIEGSVFE